MRKPTYFDYFRPADMGDLSRKMREFSPNIVMDDFDVQHTIKGRSSGKVKYSTSLFIENHDITDPEMNLLGITSLPLHSKNETDAFLIQNGWSKKSRSWWDTYLRPICQFNDPYVNLEVYTCPWLFHQLEKSGMLNGNHTYHVMSSPSVRHNPGAMWRFKGLDSDMPVFIVDADALDTERPGIDQWLRSKAKWWRAAHNGANELNSFDNRSVFYHPITASQFGCIGGVVSDDIITEQMKVFYWAASMGLVQNEVWHPGIEKSCPIFGRSPSGYGFDEVFCAQVLFPQMLKDGLFSVFPPRDRRSTFGQLDLEMCQALHPSSGNETVVI